MEDEDRGKVSQGQTLVGINLRKEGGEGKERGEGGKHLTHKEAIPKSTRKETPMALICPSHSNKHMQSMALPCRLRPHITMNLVQLYGILNLSMFLNNSSTFSPQKAQQKTRRPLHATWFSQHQPYLPKT